MKYETTRDSYRACFSTESGKRVLGLLLVDLGFFEEATTEEHVANRNFAIKLLRNLGLFNPPKEGTVVFDGTIESFVQKLFDIPVLDIGNS